MKVLVAIDNRPSSQAILDAVVKMHWAEGTEIVLLTVFARGSGDNVREEEPDAEREVMENVAVELCTTLKNQCDTRFLARPGDPTTVILDLAKQISADLIVVGSNCKSTLERVLLGSVSESVISHAHCPVIVAKTPCCLAREVSPAFKTVLVPVDNSLFSDAAVQWLANFHWAPHSRFVVAAVVPEDTDFGEVKRSLQKRASDLSKFLNTDNVIIEIATGSPQHSIIDLCKEYYADLIVMGSHGHTGLKERILGGVCQAVSHAAPCAVAIVRVPSLDENNVHSSGEYGKAKTVSAPDFASTYRNDESRNDVTVHSMPGGF